MKTCQKRLLLKAQDTQDYELHSVNAINMIYFILLNNLFSVFSLNSLLVISLPNSLYFFSIEDCIFLQEYPEL